MAEADDLVAIEEVLQQLERISFVAQRDARAALPALREIGAAPARSWIETARDLFLHDREAGKSFMRHSVRLAENLRSAEPWTGQAREFLRWVNSYHALEGFLGTGGPGLGELGRGGRTRVVRNRPALVPPQPAGCARLFRGPLRAPGRRARGGGPAGADHPGRASV
jgi:hypothetical protein